MFFGEGDKIEEEMLRCWP